MGRRGPMGVLLSLFLLVATFVGAAEAETDVPSYGIVLIGEQVPGATAGSALAVNESGDTVGYVAFGSASWDHFPFIYTAEHGATLLPRPEWAVTARARDVSDRHADGTVDIVGWAANSIYSGDLAVRWKYSTFAGEVIEMVELGTIKELPQSQATDVNAVGDIVGYSAGFMQFDGAATLFTAAGPEQISDSNLYGVADVTDNRWVLLKGAIGTATANRYDLATGAMVDLGVPEGSLYTSTGAAMNESFQVAATVTTGDTDPRGQYIAQVWRHSEDEGWRFIAGGGNSLDHARGINNRGDVLAQIVVGLTYYDLLYLDALDQAFVIESLLEPGLEGTMIGALNDINDRGDIATSGPGGPVLLVPGGEVEPPPAPADLVATPHPPTPQQPFSSIDLSWTGSSPLTLQFSIERAPTGGSFTEIGTTTAQNHSDLTISAGVTYDYRVRALGVAGYSPYSNVVTATAPTGDSDTEPPTVEFVEPADGATVKRTVTVTVSAADAGGLASIDISASGPTSGDICYETLDTPITAEVTCRWNTRKAEPGDYTLYAIAADQWGNWSSASITVTVESGRGDRPPR